MSSEELNTIVEKYFTSRTRKGYGNFKGYTLPLAFEKICKDIEDMEVYDDDIWVCTFPKSGTTWVQEMVWCICNNLDFQAAEEPLERRFVYLEQSCVFDVDDKDQPDILLKSVDVVKNMQRPRFIKSHLPWQLLPKKIVNYEKRPKIIHVVRNPLDTFVSYYYFAKMLGSFSGDIELLGQLFLKHKVNYSPYDDHVLSYWNQRNQPNVFFIKYEDMKTNLSLVIDTVSDILGKTLPEGGKDKLISFLSFESMKKKQTSAPNTMIEFMQKNNEMYDKEGRFMRSGKSGGYRSEMSAEAIELFKKQFVHKFEEAGLKFSTLFKD